MAGQGSPHLKSDFRKQRFAEFRYHGRIPIGRRQACALSYREVFTHAVLRSSYILFLIAACALTFPNASMAQPQITGFAEEDDVNLRLRVAWGGGARTRWNGRIELTDGNVLSRSSLGLEPNAPGSKLIENGELILHGRNATSFDGVDIEIVAPLDASLRIELTAGPGIENRYVNEIPVSQLIDGRHAEPIDSSENWISIQRAWGDQLRIEFMRDSLVFGSEETFRFDVVPNELSLEPDTSYDLDVRLTPKGSREPVWSNRYPVETGPDGKLPPIRDIAVPLPSGDGACQVVCELQTKRQGAPFFRRRTILDRAIDLVVVDEQSKWLSSDTWDEQLMLDPANPGWWDRLRGLPQLRLVPGLGKEPLGMHFQTITDDQGETWTEIAPGGWVAYPLPIKQTGYAHRIDIDYSQQTPQEMGVSLVEPNSAGRVIPLGPDSGIIVQAHPGESADSIPSIGTHSILVWPRTPVPLLLIHNLDETRSARFSKVRVSVAADSRFVRRTELEAFDDPNASQKRKFASLIDAPLLPESFSAPEAFDPIADRTLDDWNSFYVAGFRLCESLKIQSRNTAIVSALNEGSTIYPSRLLDSTPKYDSGTYFANGQDVIRKDVLEMMFRLFDREDLTLIPQIEFASPLPDLERQLRAAEKLANGSTSIPLISDTDVLGGASHHIGIAHYNPASLEVQQAMFDVIEEIIQRYSHHPSFGGVSIRIGSNTYTHFPDERWGYDFPTVHRYLMDKRQIRIDSSRDEISQAYYDVVQRRPDDYLEWRAAQLTDFYQRVASLVTRSKASSRLYLSSADLFRDRNSIRVLFPEIRETKPSLERVLLTMGLQPTALSQQPGLMVIQPTREDPTAELATNRVERHLLTSGVLASSFTGRHESGMLLHQPLRPVQLEGFAEQSPFGEANTELILFPHISRRMDLQRKPYAQSLATSDQRLFVEGAMTAPTTLGQGLAAFSREFQALPDVPFEDVEVRMPGRQAAPVVLRRAIVGRRNYLYLVNRTPWSVSVDVTLQSESPLFVSPLTNREFRLTRPDGRNDSKLGVMRVNLQPYDLVGVVIDPENCAIEDVQIRYLNPVGIREHLSRQLRVLQNEVEEAGSRPIDWNVISNPSFEESDGQQIVAGWEVPTLPSVEFDTPVVTAHSGQRALRMTTTGDQFGWIRSEPFDAPTTGRISISVWLKLDELTQPPLRISLEGRHWGEEYYRFAEVGSLAEDDEQRQVTGEWKRFSVHFDDLPPEGMNNLRIGFDMMGRGSVWIDHVQVHDLWLDEHDVLSLLTIRLNLLDALARGDYVGCLNYFETYWAEVLLRRPSLRRKSYEVIADQRADDASSSFSRKVLERVKGLAPQSMLPFR